MKGRKPRVVLQFDPSQNLKGEVVKVKNNEINEINEKLVSELCSPKFSEDEKTIWNELATIINEAGHLSKKTSFRIKMIVPKIVMHDEIQTQINKEGFDWKSEGGRNGLQKKAHHLFPTLNMLVKQIDRFGDSFGLDPVAEKRLKDVRQGDLFGGDEFSNNGV